MKLKLSTVRPRDAVALEPLVPWTLAVQQEVFEKMTRSRMAIAPVAMAAPAPAAA